MEEEIAFPDLTDFEFFTVILKNSWGKMRLPDKFARLLHGREPREVKLREAGGSGRRLWDVEVVFDRGGHMYLGRGWEQFARAHSLRLGHFLVFSYDGDAVLAVKVFDVNMCRRHYQHDSPPASPGSGSSSSYDDDGSYDIDSSDAAAAASQFTVMLRPCHLGVRQKQYLNVPLEFYIAHRYGGRSKVVLRMRGASWTVNLKHSRGCNRLPRAAFRYGWHQFCVDNRLGVGDTCFFRALHHGDGDGDDHVLKVEVRRRDGTFVA